MANFFLYIQILFFYFLIAGLLFYIASRKKDLAFRKALWKKFGVYFLLVFVVMFLFFVGGIYTISLLLILQFFAIREWWLSKNGLSFFAMWSSGGVLLAVLITPYIQYPSGDELLAYYFFVVIFDGFSQAFGQWLKGPKILPSVSPNKTWSGFLGGCVMLLLARYFLVDFGLHTIEIVILSFVALAGDLLASGFKRIAQIKDYPMLIPGHGGVLDRFDSFFFVLFFTTIIKCCAYVS